MIAFLQAELLSLRIKMIVYKHFITDNILNALNELVKLFCFHIEVGLLSYV